MNDSCRLVVLISGNGSNLQAILDAVRDQALPVRVALVISNVATAFGLERAARAGVPTAVVDHRHYRERRAFDAALAARIDDAGPDLVALAGFMRILTDPFVDAYAGRLLNVHPSLLPAYKGLDTHRRALADGASEHGASVHFVVPELDSGPVIVRGIVPVLAGDDPHSLEQRVHVAEHRIYPLAVRWFAEGRLEIAGDRVLLDSHESPEQTVRLGQDEFG